MKKILIIYNYILHYRVPFFNELSKYFDVTVIHSGKTIKKRNDLYKEIIVETNKLGPFYIQKEVLTEGARKDYDIIITLFDLRWLSSIYLFLKMKATGDKRLNILWGAWMTKSSIANIVRLKLMQLAKSSVFYTQKSRNDFINFGLNSKAYVANNTFDVPESIRSNCAWHKEKDYILTVGSLEKRKGLDDLIKSFKEAEPKLNDKVKLVIIGDGPEGDNLKKLVSDLNIKNRVLFKGAINAPEELINYYKRAIVCCSYNQAGLFVLQSLAYGVPFLTRKKAISGGEKYNIIDKVNGRLIGDNSFELSEALLSFCNNIEEARKIGSNAYEYYTKFCTISNMTQGFLDAIRSENKTIIDIRQNDYDY